MDISIIVVAHNEEQTISRCLDSLLSQSQEVSEVILVDDASTDRIREIALSYLEKDARLRIISNTKQSGVSYSRNLGAETSNGKILVFTDGDCIPCGTWVEKLVGTMNETGADVACGRAIPLNQEQDGPKLNIKDIYLGYVNAFTVQRFDSWPGHLSLLSENCSYE